MSASAIAENTWLQASWATFIDLANNPAYTHARFYYHDGWMRVEMAPVGRSHAQDNSLIAAIVLAWAIRSGQRLWGLVNPTLRKAELAEAQPDLAYYLNEVRLPGRTNAPLDLAVYAPPDLVIEVSASTLNDDLETKRRLYAQMGVGEYWVVDSRSSQVTIFVSQLSTQSQRSQVLPDLDTLVLHQALQIGQAEGDAAAAQYILGAKLEG
ncbi:hypothetical protein GKIL_0989 [Gloeobacter kilaueensis JS1]|uniref:Putative restriction endonuclease domain-containing protein n=2 Tax=Gloeobacter TaxID=33071 RepID=U5QHU5_GLOK1|nr:Uma2 family endonuclease [Gloeobacter kilaueensis]AGY57235.1 hypothetical protein GKIL_0989 [Gloeobacter kilaueensis JS1]